MSKKVTHLHYLGHLYKHLDHSAIIIFETLYISAQV